VINSGGIKLISEQIEEKLRTIIKSRFFIAGLPDGTMGQKLVLFVEGVTDPDGLHSKIKGLSELQKFERPREIISVPVFVETENGKIRRKATVALANL
jgi:O-succinylbenzoic acid--CoA ligase